jgi:hypothetical protein
MCLYVYPFIVSRHRLGKKEKNVNRCNEYTLNNRWIVGPAVFYAARVVWRKLDSSSKNFLFKMKILHRAPYLAVNVGKCRNLICIIFVIVH